MKHLKGYQFELRPNKEQARSLRKFLGCARFVRNKGLAFYLDFRESMMLPGLDGGQAAVYFSYEAVASYLTGWKEEHPWLKECPAQVLQHSLKDLAFGFDCFGRGQNGFPVFHKRGKNDSIRYPQYVEVDQFEIKDGLGVDRKVNKVYLPKIGWVNINLHRKIPDDGKIKSATIYYKAGKWTISLLVERDLLNPDGTEPTAEEYAAMLRPFAAPPSYRWVGVDRGVVNTAVLSNGQIFTSPRFFEESMDKLAKLQRQLAHTREHTSNKDKKSNKINRLNLQIAKLHAHIANQRKNYLQQFTTMLIKNHGCIVLEALGAASMSKSAAGTAENPGKNVVQKRALNRGILDQGWYMMLTMLQYKAAWYGNTIILVDPKNTSRTCPCCGHVDAKNRVSQSRFVCTKCQYENHADIVGAVNILRRGKKAPTLSAGQDKAKQGGKKKKATSASPSAKRAPKCVPSERVKSSATRTSPHFNVDGSPLL